MTHAPSPSTSLADAEAAHPEPVEAPESRAERETAEGVESAMARGLGRPLGLMLFIVGVGVTLALLGGRFGAEGPARLWALVSGLVAVYGLGIGASGRRA